MKLRRLHLIGLCVVGAFSVRAQDIKNYSWSGAATPSTPPPIYRDTSDVGIPTYEMVDGRLHAASPGVIGDWVGMQFDWPFESALANSESISGSLKLRLNSLENNGNAAGNRIRLFQFNAPWANGLTALFTLMGADSKVDLGPDQWRPGGHGEWNKWEMNPNVVVEPAPGWPEPTWNIYAMFPSSSGELWVGGERGVGWWQAGFWHLLDLDPGLVEERVRHIAQDASGTIWFATAGNGLWSYREGKVARYGRGQGLLSEYLTCLHADADRNLWIGTKGGGLWRHRQGRFAAITTANGLPSDTVMSIASGAAHLWLATFSGLVRVNAEQLAACAEGRRRTIDFLQLDLSDGLKSLQFEGPNQPNACRTPDGRLWFATGAGLALVDERDIYTNTLAPGVVIDRLLVDGESLTPSRGTENGPRRAAAWDAYSLTPSVVVPAGARRVEIQYAGLSFAAPQRMRFQHRLEGWEDRYTDAGNGRAAHYNYLQPGQYVFHVRACNNDGVWNESGARIGLLSESALGKLEAASAPAAADVQRIHRTAHDLTCALDEIVWAVNPRHDTVDSLVNYLTNYAEETLQTADIRLNLDLPVALPPWPLCVETRHNLFLAVKEALHNVVKHAQATEVRLHFETAPEGFMLEVRDNGRGFANAEPGDGLWSMNKRLQDIGGDCRVQGYPGQGTCVRFHVRLTAADRSATRSAEEVSSEQTIPPSAAI